MIPPTGGSAVKSPSLDERAIRLECLKLACRHVAAVCLDLPVEAEATVTSAADPVTLANRFAAFVLTGAECRE